MKACKQEAGHCLVHGTPMNTEKGCVTAGVLADVAEHRQWQFENYGPDNYKMQNGTGKDVEWLKPITDFASDGAGEKVTAYEIEDLLRTEWDYPKDGTPEEQAQAIADCSWMRLLREEVSEAFAQEDPEWLEAELIQVAAVVVSWIATLRGEGDI